MNQTTTATSVGEQANEWQDGAPLFILSDVVLIDIRTHRRVKCAG
jgi:hypothetical protein